MTVCRYKESTNIYCGIHEIKTIKFANKSQTKEMMNTVDFTRETKMTKNPKKNHEISVNNLKFASTITRIKLK